MMEALTVLAVVCAVQSVCLPILVWANLQHERRLDRLEDSIDKVVDDLEEVDETLVGAMRHMGVPAERVEVSE